MNSESSSSSVASAELDSLFLISILFTVAQAHDRFQYFVEAMIDLVNHICPDADPEWDRYARLLRNAHNTGFSETRARLLYQEMLYIADHHRFTSNCAAWKFRSLNVFTLPKERATIQSSEWLDHINDTLSYMEADEAEMCEFVRAKLLVLTDDIGIDVAEWLQPPGIGRISDEMVDAWIAENPDVQNRLREFGL